MPLESQLEAIEELGLSRFEKLQVDTSIPQEPRWNEPVISECIKVEQCRSWAGCSKVG